MTKLYLKNKTLVFMHKLFMARLHCYSGPLQCGVVATCFAGHQGAVSTY